MDTEGRPTAPHAAPAREEPGDGDFAAESARRTRRTGEQSTRPKKRRPIRMRITALLLVPLVSLIALWAFAANITLGDAFDKYDFSTTYEKIGLPGITLVSQLQAERSLSVAALVTQQPQYKQKLGQQRARVDGLEAAFKRSALSKDAQDAAKTETKQRLTVAVRDLAKLPQLRARVDARRTETLDLINSYSVVLDDLVAVFNGFVAVDDVNIFTQGRALISLGNARASMLKEDSLVISAMGRGGRFTPAEHVAFIQFAAQGRQAFVAGLADLNASIRGPLQQLAQSPGFQRYRAAESAIVSAPGDRLPAEAGDWTATTQLLGQAWDQRVTQASLALDDMAKPIGHRIIVRLVIAGGFGLLAVIASIVLSLLAARSLSRELRGLQRAALDLAGNRLPRVVARLRRGEEVDVEAEAPPLVIGKTREVSRVGDAFTRVQHTAIETAVRESYLRQGISRVFLNVAFRSQSLLHRQLRMLDEMERGASDPKALEDLFRLDHLTTRMRRHAEGLVILSGTAPGRGWSRPVHVEDVLRSAISEVEDYTRVEVVVVSGRAAVIGEAVADIVHLLAELIENATVFSPAPTEVLVRGEMGANGFAVDIIDRGIGLDQSELDALNLRLSQPPEFDLAVTDRLGLFVVGRLAHRHGIRVALQPSLYGGVSAVVLIPRRLIVEAEGPDDEDDAPVARPSASAPGNGMANGSANGAANGAGNGALRPWPSGAAGPAPGNGTAMLNAPTPFDVEAPPAPDAPDPHAGAPAPQETQPFQEAWRLETPHLDAGPAEPRAFEPGPYESGPYETQAFEAPASFGEVPAGGGRAPLPRRVRGGNLAPQLRDDPRATPRTAPAPDDALVAWEERSAEASRDLFAALQAGWLRGRDEDEAPDGRERT
ncbi:HAMP domain-containing protein [Actinomadura sp. LD22]|uniref:histidine kinase n=1 Tax=Actinomadura physcomitrii TaxID=2650748 RepID=A0A6I4MPP2_9ACTN|nr:nitrate- and nitrite sensing domain-containing protein [Actinomadura physcomitrii]MWA04246.1 HAMP domain-containing protein [Actinomadura physcomitrii]